LLKLLFVLHLAALHVSEEAIEADTRTLRLSAAVDTESVKYSALPTVNASLQSTPNRSFRRALYFRYFISSLSTFDRKELSD
jgi:hypothetical protein